MIKKFENFVNESLFRTNLDKNLERNYIRIYTEDELEKVMNNNGHPGKLSVYVIDKKEFNPSATIQRYCTVGELAGEADPIILDDLWCKKLNADRRDVLDVFIEKYADFKIIILDRCKKSTNDNFILLDNSYDEEERSVEQFNIYVSRANTFSSNFMNK